MSVGRSVATQTRSIQAPVIGATNCNRFCGLATRWNASVQTMVLPRVALTAEEVAAAVGQQAMVFQELASALVEIRQPVVLGFPSGQALRRFFAARREQPLAE
jgi:hypothetical protein